MSDRERDDDMGFDIKAILIRVITTIVVVGIAAFLTPGFSIRNIWSLIVASIVIALVDYIIAKLTGVDATPFGRGIVGFVVSALILYATKYLVAGFDISVWGAIIGALIIGVIDAIIPGKSAL
ncbi:putative membrane protein [Gottschalkia acidurici 9a]|uniref:Membrane protein n=1 Tax=Gottschalkia acidurici (strain ATCC 7906 / DSM 604 / BCRC 14475 / CIP 104303 / KCTC 5404 / NCIMB 10678 / 9a) TaxID=1128398 RepID=K0AWQ6_GOTA9|nr:phage holin family protein [Gottschalkia acidurici]AFS77212.1 putative membrane protein [Gottschalkia acidurici 9a]